MKASEPSMAVVDAVSFPADVTALCTVRLKESVVAARSGAVSALGAGLLVLLLVARVGGRGRLLPVLIGDGAA
ncbi:hypothetical protein, partial [Streptomyces scabiei]|uniref:hypothetical protein n=1 Tax=Streptomyces scabiei TaxID=1930 RepID=UPI00131A9F35